MSRSTRKRQSAPIATTAESTTETAALAVVASEAEAIQHLEAEGRMVKGPEPEFTDQPTEPSVGEVVAAVEAPHPTSEPTPALKTREPAKKPERELKGMMVDLKVAYFEGKDQIDDLLAYLKQKGHNPSRSSVATIAADFRHSCRVLDSLGIRGLKGIIK